MGKWCISFSTKHLRLLAFVLARLNVDCRTGLACRAGGPGMLGTSQHRCKCPPRRFKADVDWNGVLVSSHLVKVLQEFFILKMRLTSSSPHRGDASSRSLPDLKKVKKKQKQSRLVTLKRIGNQFSIFLAFFFVHCTDDCLRMKINEKHFFISHWMISNGFKIVFLQMHSFCVPHRLFTSMKPKPAQTWLVNTTGLQTETRHFWWLRQH